MRPSILKPYLIKNKLFFCIVLFLSLIFAKPLLSASPNFERAYYYFLMSQLFTDNATDVEKNLKKALELSKDSFFLRKMLFSFYLQNNKLEEAEKIGENLYKKYPYDRDLVFLMSKLYLQQERPNRAMGVLEKYMEKNPRDDEILSFLISLYLQQKEWDLALAKLDALSKRHPDAYAIWLFKARIYREKKDQVSAKNAYLKALELAPSNKALLVETLRYLESISSFEDIEKILQDYLVKNPEDKDFLRLLLGYYLEQKSWEKSEKLLKEYLEKNKDQPEFLFYLGLTLEYKNKLEEALKIYAEIPVGSPWHLEAQKRSFELFKKQDLKLAKKFLDDLKAKGLDEKSYFLFLAHAYEDIDECEVGAEIALEGLKKYQEDPDLSLALASNYACLEDYQKVLEVVSPLLKKLPEDAYILNFVGYSLVELGREFEKAEELLLKAEKIKPNDPYIEDSLGWLYFKKDDLEKAKAYLEKAFKNAKTDEPVIWEHLGDLYLKLQKKKEACELYKKALEKTVHKREKNRLLEKVKACP